MNTNIFIFLPVFSSFSLIFLIFSLSFSFCCFILLYPFIFACEWSEFVIQSKKTGLIPIRVSVGSSVVWRQSPTRRLDASKLRHLEASTPRRLTGLDVSKSGGSDDSTFRPLNASSSRRLLSRRLDISTPRLDSRRLSTPTFWRLGHLNGLDVSRDPDVPTSRRLDAPSSPPIPVPPPPRCFLCCSLLPSPHPLPSSFLLFLREILQPPPFTSAAAANSREAAVRRLRVIQKDSKFVGIACGSKRRGLFSFY